jgi:SET domain-containing protein
MNKIAVSIYEGMGRGVMALQHMHAGDAIAICEVLPLNPRDTATVQLTELKYHTFVYNDVQDCLVLGLGDIFNHSNDANASYKLEDYAGRKMMVFTALKTIYAGEQIFTNYNQDIAVNTDAYIIGIISNCHYKSYT